MPTIKPPYAGTKDRSKVMDFTKKLRNELLTYYVPRDEDVKYYRETDQPFGKPAEQFVSVLLSEAADVRADKDEWEYLITKPECRAEQRDLLNTLEKCFDKLSSISPDLDKLLDINADTKGTADKIKELIPHVEQSSSSIEAMSFKQTLSTSRHQFANDLANRVLNVLKEYEQNIDVSAQTDLKRASTVVKIISAIGDDMGLVLSKATWRDILSKAKKTL